MIVLIALMIDWLVGEPPVKVHPVVWFGWYLQQAERLNRSIVAKHIRTILLGGSCFCLGATVITITTYGLQFSLAQLPPIAQISLTGIILKPAFAFRMLVREVEQIETALQQDLNLGRQRLSYIVSRNTAELSPIEVRESALESIAENLSDSVIAPLFWFLLWGLPGAYLYRFVNTADAMWGYRNERYEYWGKVAARMDDLMNWIPARLTGLWLLYFSGCGLLRRSGWARDARPYQMLCAESKKTPSPNSGWSMAAFALRLGVHLGKPGVYVLNPMGDDVDAELAIAGIRWISRSGWVLALLFALISGLVEIYAK